MEEECLKYSWLSEYSVKKYCLALPHCSSCSSETSASSGSSAATTLCLHQESIRLVGRFWGMGKEITFIYGKEQLNILKVESQHLSVHSG